MSDPARLHDVDFYRWTQEQAALLRRVPAANVSISPSTGTTLPKRSRTWGAAVYAPSTAAQG